MGLQIRLWLLFVGLCFGMDMLGDMEAREMDMLKAMKAKRRMQLAREDGKQFVRVSYCSDTQVFFNRIFYHEPIGKGYRDHCYHYPLSARTEKHLNALCEQRACTIGQYDDDWLGGYDWDDHVGAVQEEPEYGTHITKTLRQDIASRLKKGEGEPIRAVCVSMVYDANWKPLPDEYREIEPMPYDTTEPYTFYVPDNMWKQPEQGGTLQAFDGHDADVPVASIRPGVPAREMKKLGYTSTMRDMCADYYKQSSVGSPRARFIFWAPVNNPHLGSDGGQKKTPQSAWAGVDNTWISNMVDLDPFPYNIIYQFKFFRNSDKRKTGSKNIGILWGQKLVEQLYRDENHKFEKRRSIPKDDPEAMEAQFVQHTLQMAHNMVGPALQVQFEQGNIDPKERDQKYRILLYKLFKAEMEKKGINPDKHVIQRMQFELRKLDEANRAQAPLTTLVDGEEDEDDDDLLSAQFNSMK